MDESSQEPVAPVAATPIDVAKSALAVRAKAQLRIALAGLAGALVSKHILPAGLLDDTLLDGLAGVILAGAAAYWQDFRAMLNHSRLWALAINKRVPDDLVRPEVSAS